MLLVLDLFSECEDFAVDLVFSVKSQRYLIVFKLRVDTANIYPRTPLSRVRAWHW
jgi:hypothetical protein